ISGPRWLIIGTAWACRMAGRTCVGPGMKSLMTLLLTEWSSRAVGSDPDATACACAGRAVAGPGDIGSGAAAALEVSTGSDAAVIDHTFVVGIGTCPTQRQMCDQ